MPPTKEEKCLKNEIEVELLWDLNKSRLPPLGKYISEKCTGAFLVDHQPTSVEILSDLDIRKACYFIISGEKYNITMTLTSTVLSHTDLLGLLRGALTHKSKAKQQIRLLLPHSQASEIHFSTDEEWKIALTFTAHVLLQQNRQTAGESHEIVLRFFAIIKLFSLI